jgi:hypothetical protein
MSGPDMPDWASPDGPWCLKRWLPLPSGTPPKFDLCLLPPGHKSDCRTFHNGWQNHDNARYLGEQPVTP